MLPGFPSDAMRVNKYSHPNMNCEGKPLGLTTPKSLSARNEREPCVLSESAVISICNPCIMAAGCASYFVRPHIMLGCTGGGCDIITQGCMETNHTAITYTGDLGRGVNIAFIDHKKSLRLYNSPMLKRMKLTHCNDFTSLCELSSLYQRGNSLVKSLELTQVSHSNTVWLSTFRERLSTFRESTFKQCG